MTGTTDTRLVLVGNPDPVHVGAHLRLAANELGHPTVFLDTGAAFAGGLLRRRANWWLRGHRPSRLRAFSQQVVSACATRSARWLVTTGFAPVDAMALRELGRLGVRRVNFLTDDPWNPAQRAPWFLEALADYDVICSPRRANLADLEAHGCRKVCYLPFAYSPAVHFPEQPAPEEQSQFEADVVFAGGSDAERVPIVKALLRQRFRLALYGGYWERHPDTRLLARGYADARTLRKASAGGAVSLGLVRRANRDGHSMRSFELPAMGACVLAEDTCEHRELYGEEGDAVRYFGDEDHLVEQVRWLLARPEARRQLAATAFDRITHGAHTYRHRLQAMLAA